MLHKRQGPTPWPALLLALAACSAPSLLAFNVSPSPTFLNQALALASWGGFAAVDPWPTKLWRQLCWISANLQQ